MRHPRIGRGPAAWKADVQPLHQCRVRPRHGWVRVCPRWDRGGGVRCVFSTTEPSHPMAVTMLLPGVEPGPLRRGRRVLSVAPQQRFRPSERKVPPAGVEPASEARRTPLLAVAPWRQVTRAVSTAKAESLQGDSAAGRVQGCSPWLEPAWRAFLYSCSDRAARGGTHEEGTPGHA